MNEFNKDKACAWLTKRIGDFSKSKTGNKDSTSWIAYDIDDTTFCIIYNDNKDAETLMSYMIPRAYGKENGGHNLVIHRSHIPSTNFKHNNCKLEIMKTPTIQGLHVIVPNTIFQISFLGVNYVINTYPTEKDYCAPFNKYLPDQYYLRKLDVIRNQFKEYLDRCSLYSEYVKAFKEIYGYDITEKVQRDLTFVGKLIYH